MFNAAGNFETVESAVYQAFINPERIASAWRRHASSFITAPVRATPLKPSLFEHTRGASFLRSSGVPYNLVADRSSKAN
jgi:hypothetical protein